MTELPEHVAVNREYWDGMAHEWVDAGERAWDQVEPTWGQWGIRENEIHLLPEDMTGMRAIELGCGTAYVSAWMARRGASVTGIDNSAAQLRTAQRLSAQHGVVLELIHGNAETVPMPGDSFDFAISEYGAAIWADPYQWIPEAHRLLRQGGTLVFLGSHIFVGLCSPVDGSYPITRRLERPYFGSHRLDWRDAVDDPGGIEFTLTFSEWIKLFVGTGFEIVDLIEIQAPADATGSRSGISADWARDFPNEHVWTLRKKS
ncbi:class I SAM-dependent methyltransferase [Microbacterium pumilum]|uniref:Methyltransferase type 11 domain-containing protein n=1 Tax=Microbacterium pumilum TaxID=344165 RepID=A0ABN2T4Q2_9MICO